MKKEIARTFSFTRPAARTSVIITIMYVMFLFAACDMNSPLGQRAPNSQALTGQITGTTGVSTPAIPLGSVSSFSVLGGTTVTNAGITLLTGNLGVSPGTAITGFQPAPPNTIVGPGTVTGGLGTVNGTIYAGDPIAAQAHNDAVIAYDYLMAQAPNTTYEGVTQLDGKTLTPGVYNFAPSANLLVNGTLYLDFQGNSNALFIFQIGTTLVAMAGSNIIAINNNNQTCIGDNVYWAVGSSATIDNAQFIGTVIANTTITMTSSVNASGRMIAINGAVTMITDTVSSCGGGVGPNPTPGTTPEPTKEPSCTHNPASTHNPCRDFVSGGGSIEVHSKANNHKHQENDNAIFAVSGGIKDGKFWGELSFNDQRRNGVKVKSIKVTGYTIIDFTTRQIQGLADVNGKDSFTYKVIVEDNGKSGRNDFFSLELSNGYSASGTLLDGNIQIHSKCGESHDNCDKEKYDDKDERDGHNNCNKDHNRN